MTRKRSDVIARMWARPDDADRTALRSRRDARYRRVLLPHITELRTADGRGIDLNMAEEVLARHGLRNLARAERVCRGLIAGAL